jgi:hypothetical protein
MLEVFGAIANGSETFMIGVVLSLMSGKCLPNHYRKA